MLYATPLDQKNPPLLLTFESVVVPPTIPPTLVNSVEMLVFAAARLLFVRLILLFAAKTFAFIVAILFVFVVMFRLAAVRFAFSELISPSWKAALLARLARLLA